MYGDINRVDGEQALKCQHGPYQRNSSVYYVVVFLCVLPQADGDGQVGGFGRVRVRRLRGLFNDAVFEFPATPDVGHSLDVFRGVVCETVDV